MQFLRDQKIAVKIFGSILLLLALAVATITYGLIKLNNVAQQLTGVAHEDMPLIELTTEMTINQLEAALLIETALSATGVHAKLHATDIDSINASLAATDSEVNDEITKARSILQQALSHVATEELRLKEEELLKKLDHLEASQMTFRQHRNELLNSIKAGQVENLEAKVIGFEEEMAALNHETEQFLIGIEKLTEHALLTAESEEIAAFQGMLGSAILFMVVGAALGIAVSLNVIRPLKTAVDVANRMGEGDFSQQIEAGSKDETGQLLAAMGQMSEQLNEMLREVIVSSGQLNASAQRLQQVSKDSHQEISHQNSNTELVATAVTQMVATHQEMAGSTVSASHASRKVSEEAEQGVGLVESNRNAMATLKIKVNGVADNLNSLKKDSDNIGGILDVIRDIADQTNLLALNAAIEAARAGEQGRGFAVVADEVRTLAQRTQNSIEEINNLIERLQKGTSKAVQSMDESLEYVDTTGQRADQMGASLEAIVAAIKTVNDMNTQIAAASDEQLAVAEEVNQNVVQISGSADKIMGASDMSAEASRELTELAQSMKQQVSRFKLQA